MDKQRPRLNDILSGGSGFDDLWNTTQAADEHQPIPPGTYRVLVADGRLSETKSGTPSFKLTFQVLDGPHRGRKLFHDCWLTPAALPTTKRDLAKIGIHRPEQMRQAPPAGLVVEANVVRRTEDDGATYNQVRSFKAIGEAADADPLAPDADDDEDADPADLDDGGFDWRRGRQHTPKGTPLDAADPDDQRPRSR